jgi:AbrB family looped-hinge helix DNA binding protein
MTYTAKVTSKGQVTIPKEVREALASDIVEFDIGEGRIEIRAVPRVGGKLQQYVGKSSEEESAWPLVAAEKHADR